MIKEMSWYAGCEKGNNIMVIGAGASLRKYTVPIKHFIERKKCTTIGINKMTDHIIPTYHLWTNNQRLRDQNRSIKPFSKLMLGCNIREPLRRYYSDYIDVKYASEEYLEYSFSGGIFGGHFRIAGTLAIAIAHVLNAGEGNIYVVGMDGFTLYPIADLKSEKESHHCYGAGYTDDATYAECKKKDELTTAGLHVLREAGINFKIITPTIHKDFYYEEMRLKNGQE